MASAAVAGNLEDGLSDPAGSDLGQRADLTLEQAEERIVYLCSDIVL